MTGTNQLLSQLIECRRGNIAVMFALAIVPMLGTVGGAVDYAIALGIRSKLQLAVDAASISAVAKASPAFKNAGGMGANGAIASGVSDAQNIYNGNIANLSGFQNSTLDVSVRKEGQTIISTVKFAAEVPTSFLGVFGIKAIPISGTSSSAASLPSYIDFHLLLDNSPSMGVAASTAEIAALKSKTPDNCAFACHDESKAKDNLAIAKENGINTRIDVLRKATQQLMDTARATQSYNGQFRMAIYDFGEKIASTTLRELFSLSSNLTSAKSAAGDIKLMSVRYHHDSGDQGTNFTKIIPLMGPRIGVPGPGTSNAPQKYLFFVTDGVADESNSSCLAYPPSATNHPVTSDNRCHSPLNAALCDSFKNRGIKIAVLYTTYLELPDNGWYMDWIAPFNPKPFSPSINSRISKNLEACASPGLYFEVGLDQGIGEAMNALFYKAVADARITS